MYLIVEEGVYRHNIWCEDTLEEAIEKAKEICSTEDDYHKYRVYHHSDTDKEVCYVTNTLNKDFRDSFRKDGIFQHKGWRLVPNSLKYTTKVVTLE